MLLPRAVLLLIQPTLRRAWVMSASSSGSSTAAAPLYIAQRKPRWLLAAEMPRHIPQDAAATAVRAGPAAPALQDRPRHTDDLVL